MHAEEKELLPCPFCGGEAFVDRVGDSRRSCIVACSDCSCRLESNENGFGEAWNRRAKIIEAAATSHNKQSTPCLHSSHYSTHSTISYCPKCGKVVG